MESVNAQTKAVKYNDDPFFFAGLYSALYVAWIWTIIRTVDNREL